VPTRFTQFNCSCRCSSWFRFGLPSLTSGKMGFYPPPLVPKLFGPGLKVALVPVRAAGVRPAPSPGS
jgi:hypothetical protein